MGRCQGHVTCFLNFGTLPIYGKSEEVDTSNLVHGLKMSSSG